MTEAATRGFDTLKCVEGIGINAIAIGLKRVRHCHRRLKRIGERFDSTYFGHA